MKLDMSAAWNDAVAMIKANREVMAVIAGVFFFLPGLAALFFIEQLGELPPDVEPEAAARILLDYLSENAVPLLLLTLVSTVGFLALLALLRNDRKPTVGEAIGSGFTGLLPYVGAQLIAGMGMVLIVGVLVGTPAALGLGPIAIVTLLIALVLLIYVGTKLSLVMPVIAIEHQANPVSVLRRSWELTKGNSVRLFLFYLLLGLGFGVLSQVIDLFFGLLFSLLGGSIAKIATGTVASLVSAAGSLVFAAVLAAIHRQLNPPAASVRQA